MRPLAPVLALACAIVALSACDDSLFNGTTDTAATGGGWCAAQSAFEGECVSCHSPAGGVQGGLDLQTDAHAALVDVPSSAYPGRTLVVPGDPTGSFLLVKLQGLQTSGEGVSMPPGGSLSQGTIDAITAWIADGATTVCTVDTDTRTCDPTNEECRPGHCSGEGGNMLPGADCLSCHRAGGDDEAPAWTAAGTAFSDVYGTDALAGATIHIVGADGNQIDLRTNSVGNFYTRQAIAMPFTASIETADGIRSMTAEQSSGACNSCHACDGEAGGKLTGP